MLGKLKHAVRVARAHIHEISKSHPLSKRSSKWPALEHRVKAKHPSCAACKSGLRLQVHHKKPFHLHPELELDETNLIVLCMGPNECHILIGHGDSFKAYNPNVEADAAAALADPSQLTALAAKAKANRLSA